MSRKYAKAKEETKTQMTRTSPLQKLEGGGNKQRMARNGKERKRQKQGEAKEDGGRQTPKKETPPESHAQGLGCRKSRQPTKKETHPESHAQGRGGGIAADATHKLLPMIYPLIF